MTVSEFISKFKYSKGITFIDGWCKIDQNPYSGDCDDFALTVLYLAEGNWFNVLWALFTFKAVFWLVYSPQNKLLPRHVVLWHRNYGWIDSTERQWRSKPDPHTRILPLLWPWAYFRILWGLVNPFK